MSWLTNLRSKITSLTKKPSSPDTLWHKCRGCGTMLYLKDFNANLFVCTQCNFHERIGPAERFQHIFDDARYEAIALPSIADDPLKFKDSKRYVDRLRDARAATGASDCLALARGTIGGNKAVVGVQNFAFMAGSMGIAVGEAFLAACIAAIENRAPLIMFTAAGGARMQEGIMSLMQMPRTTLGVTDLRAARLPYIVVLTDPTTGGVTASFAMLGDVQLAEPGALIGFAGQRVIESTIRETLPEGFQRAEYLYAHGMIDQVVDRRQLRQRLATIIDLLKPSAAPVAQDATALTPAA